MFSDINSRKGHWTSYQIQTKLVWISTIKLTIKSNLITNLQVSCGFIIVIAKKGFLIKSAQHDSWGRCCKISRNFYQQTVCRIQCAVVTECMLLKRQNIKYMRSFLTSNCQSFPVKSQFDQNTDETAVCCGYPLSNILAGHKHLQYIIIIVIKQTLQCCNKMKIFPINILFFSPLLFK